MPAVLVLVAGVATAGKPSKRLGDDERGKLLYERHCVQCHGVAGAGDGPATEALVAEVPDLRGKVDDGNIEAEARVVIDGRNAMPGFEASFDKHDARRVLRHLRKIAKPGEVKPKTENSTAPQPTVDSDSDESDE